MNNRETSGSPDAGDPGEERHQRQHQREADQFRGSLVPAAGRLPRLFRYIGGIGFTHMTPPHPHQTTRAPGDPGPLQLVGRFRLLQRGVDRGELVVRVGAEAVDHSDNRERNAGCDQAVFDGGGPGLILHETRNQVLHWVKLHVYTWLVELTFGLAGVLSTVTMAPP